SAMAYAPFGRATIFFFDVVPSARTAGLYFEKYGSFLTSAVRSASWPLSPSVRASVNGTSNTVGSVPAASLAANVGPVHWYSTAFVASVAALDTELAITATAPARMTAAVLAIRVDFIVPPFAVDLLHSPG